MFILRFSGILSEESLMSSDQMWLSYSVELTLLKGISLGLLILVSSVIRVSLRSFWSKTCRLCVLVEEGILRRMWLEFGPWSLPLVFIINLMISSSCPRDWDFLICISRGICFLLLRIYMGVTRTRMLRIIRCTYWRVFLGRLIRWMFHCSFRIGMSLERGFCPMSTGVMLWRVFSIRLFMGWLILSRWIKRIN